MLNTPRDYNVFGGRYAGHSGASEGLPQGVYSKLARYRHNVFVEQLGWGLQTQDGTELDQFDRPDTVYVVAQDDEGHIFGCARLLPTTR